jgi:SAM-dependent methyltransferase
MNRDLKLYGEAYARQPYEKYQVAFRKRKIREILARYTHNSLLEVGCGLESIFEEIDSYNDITIVEPAQMFYENALANKAKHPGKNIKIIHASLEEAGEKLTGANFDFILVSSLLHEIPEQNLFLKSLYNISAPQTVVHVNVPNARSFHRLLAVEMGLIPDVFEKSESNILFQQHTVFDLPMLQDIVTRNGFLVIESGSYSFKPFTHSQMQAMIDNGTITEAMLEGFYKMEKHIPGTGSEIYVNMKKI